jgi:endogenous inhibitor of DNA gyrase (YacG/DUF329 family)
MKTSKRPYSGATVKCPTCGSVFEAKAKRVCSKCGKIIGRHDKFTFMPDSRVAHRHCDRPDQYV